MDELSRIIGTLEQFKESTEADLESIKRDLGDLKQFRWRLAGGLSLLIAVCELGIALFGHGG